MGTTRPLDPSDALLHPPEARTSVSHPHLDDWEVDVLREENKQLRELVIQLSKIVLTNAVRGQ